jgi:hypothetical protein
VEHHLFPQVPRHNLAAVHAEVARFCREEGMAFHEANMVDGTVEVLACEGERERGRGREGERERGREGENE